MKKLLLCGLSITAAAMVLTGCSGNTKEEEQSSIFEAQPGIEAGGTENQNAADNNETDTNAQNENAESTENAETAQVSGVSICDETSELDFNNDYIDEIKVAVDRAVAEASSLNDEFTKIGQIEDHIFSRMPEDAKQVEMNMVANYRFQVWDTELNSLWDRFSKTVDESTKERVLSDQRNWNAMKEDAALEALGPQEEGGSIYPTLYSSFMEDSTKARCYFIAKEIAAAKGDSFSMPAKSIFGAYIDSQGTDSIYSQLSVTESWESGYIAKISIYRLGELEGSADEAGDGSLSFVSYDDSVKGTITYSWDGATFEVTEVNGDAIVGVGETFEFPLVF